MFEGTINVSSLSPSFSALDVSNNKISGVVDLTAHGLEGIGINLCDNPITAVIYKDLLPGVSQCGYHRINDFVTRYTPETYAAFMSEKSVKKGV